MAIYKGREVSILNYVTPGATNPDVIQVVDKDNQSYTAPIGELQFTKDEVEELKNYHTNRFDNVNIIKDADLKKVREDSDPKVLEDRMKKNQSGQDVAIIAKNAEVKTTPAANKTVTTPLVK